MATPYEREYTVVTTGSNEIVALDFPGRGELARIGIVKVGGGALTVDVFNRAFTTATSNVIRTVQGTAPATLKYYLKTAVAVKVGDLVTVAGSSVGGYNNSTQRVTKVENDGKTINTSGTAYSADATGGTMKLDIPAAEQPLYKAYTQITGTANGEQVVTQQYMNQDAQFSVPNRGVPRKIYLKFATADTYKVAIRARLGVTIS